MTGGEGRDDTDGKHTLDDHSWGDFMPHEHGPDADHDHDDMELGPLEENPIWIQDNVTLHSVGIDIGSAGTQVVFSRIKLRRMGEQLTSRFVVVERETLFQSPVRLTPYSDEHNIDDRKLGELIDDLVTEERSAADIRAIVPEISGDLGAYWQQTLTFLGIALDYLPTFLASRGQADSMALRGQRLDRLALAAPLLWGVRPVIAAGSTGSIPATRALLATIAALPQGAVVLTPA